MKKFMFLFMSALIALAGCRQGGGAGHTDIPDAALGKPVEEVYLLSNQPGLSDTALAAQRRMAEGEVRKRIDTSAKQMVSVLEKDVYQIQAILRGSEVSFDENVKAGWIDFEGGNSYKYGIYTDHMGGGTYHFDPVKSVILLLDHNPRIKPQEFQALISEDSLVLVGLPTYQDNNMQAKLNRVMVLPKGKQKQSQ